VVRVHPGQTFQIAGRTYRAGEVMRIAKGEEVPPEVVATPNQLRSWGFDPLKHAMLIKISGLHRAEDLVKNPTLLQQADQRLREYISMVNY
jgi:hypothetical protein